MNNRIYWIEAVMVFAAGFVIGKYYRARPERKKRVDSGYGKGVKLENGKIIIDMQGEDDA